MGCRANTLFLPRFSDADRHLRPDEYASLREALTHLRAVMKMAEDAGTTASLELTGEDICCLLEPAEAHIARVLRI